MKVYMSEGGAFRAEEEGVIRNLYRFVFRRKEDGRPCLIGVYGRTEFRAITEFKRFTRTITFERVDSVREALRP